MIQLAQSVERNYVYMNKVQLVWLVAMNVKKQTVLFAIQLLEANELTVY